MPSLPVIDATKLQALIELGKALAAIRTQQSAAPAIKRTRTISELEAEGFVSFSSDRPSLTGAGRSALVRGCTGRWSDAL